jgi:hypothetical protein
VLYSWGELLPNRTVFYGVLGLAGCAASGWPRVSSATAWLIGKRPCARESALADAGRFGFAFGAFLLAVISLVNSKFNPFIYFRF